MFSVITAKNYFFFVLRGEGMTIFLGMGVSDNENEYNLFGGKWCTEYSFQVFSTNNPIPYDYKTRKTSLVLLGRSFPKTIGFTHEYIYTNFVNFTKIGSELRSGGHRHLF